MGRKNGVVWLNDGRGDTGSRVNGELKLHLFAVFGGETLLEEGTKARASTTTKGVEDEETLERVTVI